MPGKTAPLPVIQRRGTGWARLGALTCACPAQPHSHPTLTDGRGVVEKKLCERLSLSSEGAASVSGLGVEGTP